jgi:indoleamine 2,3-dioxygenase
VSLLGILEEIYLFRNGHWQFVQKYIMSNTKYAKATGGTPIISWIPNQIKAVISAMDSCIQSISPTYEQTKILLFKTELQVKKELLNDQLSALQMPDYQAEDVFILNKTYKLEDET